MWEGVGFKLRIWSKLILNAKSLKIYCGLRFINKNIELIGLYEITFQGIIFLFELDSKMIYAFITFITLWKHRM